MVRANISAMHHCRRRVSYGARITNGGKGVERGGRRPLVSWCLVPFSRALIIRIDRASFEAKTCLNSAATGSSAFLSSSRSLSVLNAARQARRLPSLSFGSKDANDRRLIYSCVIFTLLSIPS